MQRIASIIIKTLDHKIDLGLWKLGNGFYSIADASLRYHDFFRFMPRGTIHQGYCLEEIHSLHITISCHQRHTFGDLLEKVMASGISAALKNDVEFRKGLPLDFLSYMGNAHCGSDSSKRREFIQRVTELTSRMITMSSVDNGADQIGKKFIHDTLPPYLTLSESKR